MPEHQNVLLNVETREANKVAALDIGSNSFHLVIARILAGSVQILHKVKQKVRLADGLDKYNVLSQDAMQRGLSTLGVIAESLQGFEPDSVRIVATYTLRKAVNAKDFIKAASYILPYPIEVISGIEEARLIYSGVAHTNQNIGQRLVVDIGGGSTEFIIGEGYDAKLMRSLQMGCVSYTKRFFSKGELKRKAFDKAITAARQELEMIDGKFCKLGWQHCIGTSGTIRIITLLARSVAEQSQMGVVTLEDLHTLIDACCEAEHVDQLNFDYLSEDRRPVLAAGLSILTAIFTSLEITEMHFSSAALREGVIYEMEDKLTHPDIRERTAESLATRYDVDVEQAKRVLDVTMELQQSCLDGWKMDDIEIRSMLGWAALLHEVGLHINSRGVQRHSGYILKNTVLPGFNQEQQDLLATLVRFHRKKIRTGEVPEFSQYEPATVHRMIALLRLGVLLNIKRQDGILPPIKFKVSKHTMTLTFPKEWLSQKPIFSADLAREAEQITALGLTLNYS